MKILIMGLPGSGKTYLAERLQPLLNAAWYNADKVREMANDWDFSLEGRIRQSKRMKTFADFEKSNNRVVICDFVCPTKNTQDNFDPDIIIWMNTIESGRYEDTNKIFEKPEKVDFHIKTLSDQNHITIAEELLKNV
ncbi:adenylyl-sulfate kinase [Gammaproteobacteria bacterium]|nr:adenylyl-sulfate kinase [Gammaproteobacteria bacterium]